MYMSYSALLSARVVCPVQNYATFPRWGVLAAVDVRLETSPDAPVHARAAPRAAPPASERDLEGCDGRNSDSGTPYGVLCDI
eukprot:COSAG03_NODE_551_length_6981_cov_20.070038_9_plen_82_part_00